MSAARQTGHAVANLRRALPTVRLQQAGRPDSTMPVTRWVIDVSAPTGI
ncbi:MAG: hypothetical protein ABI724_11295 [Betaproteobacteria bacterium]